MRSFNERREEIFRRSNDIIAGKNRHMRQVLSVLYIIVLLTAIGTTSTINQSKNTLPCPSVNDAETEKSLETRNSVDDELNGAYSVEIGKNTSSDRLPKSIEGELIKSEIDAILNSDEQKCKSVEVECVPQSDLTDPADQADSFNDDKSESKSYIINIAIDDGAVKSYIFKDNTLYCEDSKEMIILTEEQQERLLAIILNTD